MIDKNNNKNFYNKRELVFFWKVKQINGLDLNQYKLKNKMKHDNIIEAYV